MNFGPILINSPYISSFQSNIDITGCVLKVMQQASRLGARSRYSKRKFKSYLCSDEIVQIYIHLYMCLYTFNEVH